MKNSLSALILLLSFHATNVMAASQDNPGSKGKASCGATGAPGSFADQSHLIRPAGLVVPKTKGMNASRKNSLI